MKNLFIKKTVKKVWKSKATGDYLVHEGKNVRVATIDEVSAYTEKISKTGKKIEEI